MITKVQGKTLLGQMTVKKQSRLSGVEKAMLKWAVIDPDDRLLDANIGNGVMAEYLRRNMQCEVCGVSDRMDEVRCARTNLQNCDIVYAAAGDIPWKEHAFDAVLLQHRGEEPGLWSRVLGEAVRVLRDGGQLILGCVSYPPPLNAVADLITADGMEERAAFSRSDTEMMLRELGCEQISWRRCGVACGVMIAWKKKKTAGELLEMDEEE